MQQWLNDPKNQPIVLGAAALILICSIVFLGMMFFKSQAPYVPPIAKMPNATLGRQGMPGSGPLGQPTPAQIPAQPAPPMDNIARSPMGRRPNTPMIPGQRPVLIGTPQGIQPLGTAVAAAVTGAPMARVDPFAPYGGVIKIPAIPKPRVDSFVPTIRITNMDNAPQQNPQGMGNTGSSQYRTNQYNGQGQNSQNSIASSIVLSGVMLSNGAYALVDADNQSLVLQPGDQLPNGIGKLTNINSDSITVRTTDGQTVKVPITTGQSNTGSQYGGAGQGYQGQGYQGQGQGQGQPYVPNGGYNSNH